MTEREIGRRFKVFLKTFTDKHTKQNVHAPRIREMAERNGESLHVSFADLSEGAADIAIFATDVPSETLAIFDKAAKDVVLEQFPRELF